MSLAKTKINEDEIWFGESLNRDTILYIESCKINQFTTVFLTLEELIELRKEINKQISLKIFKKKNNGTKKNRNSILEDRR